MSDRLKGFLPDLDVDHEPNFYTTCYLVPTPVFQINNTIQSGSHQDLFADEDDDMSCCQSSTHHR